MEAFNKPQARWARLLPRIALLGIALAAPRANAYIPVSSINSLQLTVYAIYTTSDATCQTGLQASVPMTATGQAVDFASTPFLGDGPIASTVNCVVFVLGNKAVLNWSAASFTGTSTDESHGGSVNSDSVCNAGGTSGTIPICNGSTLGTGDPAAMQWPTQVQTDLATSGLTSKAIGTTAHGGGNADCSSTSNVMVLYASTGSVCTRIAELDSANGNSTTCGTGHGGCLPTSSSCGVTLTAPAAGVTTYKAVFNPNYMIGGTGATPSACGILNPFLISFAAK